MAAHISNEEYTVVVQIERINCKSWIICVIKWWWPESSLVVESYCDTWVVEYSVVICQLKCWQKGMYVHGFGCIHVCTLGRERLLDGFNAFWIIVQSAQHGESKWPHMCTLLTSTLYWVQGHPWGSTFIFSCNLCNMMPWAAGASGTAQIGLWLISLI